MKKILFFIAFSLLASNIFAKKWTNNVGVGLTLPYSVIGSDSSSGEDINQLGFGAEGFYLGCHESGFTVKADYAIGATFTKNISLQDKNTNVGFFTNVALGAGYSIPLTEKLLLSLTGMCGFDASIFTEADEDVEYAEASDSRADYETTLTLATLSIGGDIQLRYKFDSHLGLFGNFSARYIIGGLCATESIYTYDYDDRERTDKSTSDYDLWGKFRVQPTLGVCWTF